jgi:hypothetical protein
MPLPHAALAFAAPQPPTAAGRRDRVCPEGAPPGPGGFVATCLHGPRESSWLGLPTPRLPASRVRRQE